MEKNYSVHFSILVKLSTTSIEIVSGLSYLIMVWEEIFLM